MTDTPLGPPQAACPLSDHPEGEHSWRFDGDDPYIVCVYCGELQDALTGRIITAGRKA
jgi:hypothetical protein